MVSCCELHGGDSPVTLEPDCIESWVMSSYMSFPELNLVVSAIETQYLIPAP